mgnify:FL=1
MSNSGGTFQEMWATRPPRIEISGDDGQLAGVCEGIAHRYGVNAQLVRLVFLIAFFIGASGAFVYLLCYFIMPKQGRANAPVDVFLKPEAQLPPEEKGNRVLGLILFTYLLFFYAPVLLRFPNAYGLASVCSTLALVGSWWLLHQRQPEPPPQLRTTQNYQSDYAEPDYSTNTWSLSPEKLETRDSFPLEPFLFTVLALLGIFAFMVGKAAVTDDWSRFGLTDVFIDEAENIEPLDRNLGTIKVNMRELGPLDEPVELDINGTVGSIEVLLPKSGSPVDVTCTVNVGETDCPAERVEGDGQLLTLKLHQKAGSIRVVEPSAP